MRAKCFKRLVDLIGRDATLKLMQAFGGQSLYVPVLEGDVYKSARDGEMYLKYKRGAKVKDLSKEYGLAPITVEMIICAQRKKTGDDLARRIHGLKKDDET